MRHVTCALAMMGCISVLAAAQEKPTSKLKLVQKGTHKPVALTIMGIAVDADWNPCEDVWQGEGSADNGNRHRYRNLLGGCDEWVNEIGKLVNRRTQQHLNGLINSRRSSYHIGEWVEYSEAELAAAPSDASLDNYTRLSSDPPEIKYSISRRNLIPSAGFSLPGSGILFPAPSNPGSDTSQPIVRPAVTPDLEVLDSKIVTRNKEQYWVGTVRNNTAHRYTAVRIAYALTDETGAQIDTLSASIADLLPGKVWKYEIKVPNGDAKRYTLIDPVGLP